MTAPTARDRLLDDLRFGPLAYYMTGWTEEQRDMLVESMADDLLRSWVPAPEATAA
jgi:hypothetical protein